MQHFAKFHYHGFKKILASNEISYQKGKFYNGFLLPSRYHQKVPEETPELETTEIGIASPIEFALPSHNPRWKPEIFAAFDAGKAQSQVSFEEI